MGILFISHSSRNNEQALEVRDWLRDNGWGESFLDFDPEHGIAPGQRWLDELKKAGERCSAVVVLISPHWQKSVQCRVEAQLAAQLGKPVFGVIVAPTPLAELPPELTAHYQLVDISEPAKKADGFERLGFGLKRARLHSNDFAWPPPGEANRSPYRGLRALEEKDAGIFFGRDAAIARGLEILRQLRDGEPERLLVIQGASGSGKSSFLKAGLLARLLRDEANFLVLPTVRPERAGLTGSRGMLRALGLSGLPTPAELIGRLREIRRPVVDRLHRYAAAARETYTVKPPTLILPIDQAEELFASHNTESAASLDLLRMALTGDGDLVVMLAMRSDRFSELENEPRFGELPIRQFNLRRLSTGTFKEVIEGPGRLAKPPIGVEADLTDHLIARCDTPDTLPLLAFTLERLVAEYGESRKLTLSEFVESFGGVEGAIDRAAEEALRAARGDRDLPKTSEQVEALARRAFLPWLVSVESADADEAPKRRPAILRELPPDERGLIQHLVNQRLLVTDLINGETTIEVSHEAVLGHWGRLAKWIEDERGTLGTLAEVQMAAKDWQRQVAKSENEEGWLVHLGPRLIDAESLLDRPNYRQVLGTPGRDYLVACRRLEEAKRLLAEQQIRRDQEHLERRRRLQRRVAVAQLVAALVVAIFLVVAVFQTRSTSRQVSLVLVDYARKAIDEGYPERGARLAALAAQENLLKVAEPAAAPTLAAAAQASPLMMELRGHAGAVDGVDDSLDGKRILTWDVGGVGRIWNTETSTVVALSKLEGQVLGAKLDAGGKRALSWGEGGIVQAWDTATGSMIAASKHEGTVLGAMFDPSGKRILSWGADGLARVWDAATGHEITAAKHEGWIGEATFDPSGRRVLSWGKDGVLRIWDAATGRAIAAAETEGEVRGATFDGSGARVLSWGNDRILRIWDAATGRAIAAPENEGGIRGAMFDTSGMQVVSWENSGIARVWDAATGREIAFSQHGVGAGAWGGAMFDGTGKRVLSWGADRNARVWEAATGREIAASEHEGSISGAMFDGTGGRVLSWGSDGTERVWDAATGREVEVSRHEGIVYGAKFDAAGARVLSWGHDGIVRVWDANPAVELAGARNAQFDAKGVRILGRYLWTVRVWNAETGDKLSAWKNESRVNGVAIDTTGERVLSWNGAIVHLWSTATGAETSTTWHEDEVRGATFDSTGERVLSWSKADVRVGFASTGAEIATLRQQISGAAFDSSGQRFLTWASSGDVQVWATATGVEIGTLKPSSEVLGATFDASGQRVLSWRESGDVQVWSVETGSVLASSRHEGNVSGAMFDATGERVLSWGTTGARVWKASTGKEISAFEQFPVVGANFDPTGEYVLVWSIDDNIRVWNAATGADRWRFSNPTFSLRRGSSFDHSGRRVMWWTSDYGTLRIWDWPTGVELATMRHGGSLAGATFDLSGKKVLSWSLDGIARVWDVSWTVPRSSARTLIDEVCKGKLRGPDSRLDKPFVNGAGETIRYDSVRRISQADAEFAPILRGRVGEDVCAAPSWWR